MVDQSLNLSGSFSRYDPALGWMMRCVSKAPLVFPLVGFFLMVFPVFISAHIEGILNNPSLNPDLVSDIGIYVLYLIGAPALLTFSFFYYRNFNSQISHLRSDNVLVDEDSCYLELRQGLNRIVGNRTITWVCYIAAISLWVLGVITYDFGPSQNWHRPYEGGGLSVAAMMLWPAFLVAIYVIVQLVVRIAMSFIALRYLFRKSKVSIQPLHPDGAGGLGPVRSISLYLNAMVFGVGFLVAGGLYINMNLFGLSLFAPMNVLLMVAYAVGSFCVVFIPLFLAHGKMQYHRNLLLHSVNRAFQRSNAQLTGILNSEKFNFDEFKAIQDEMESFSKLHELASRQPVWPFNLSILYTFLGSILTPLALIILQEFISQLL